ncbi:hypothetical protein [Pseudomonas sputi]|uniref:hypothetical protein n=1 Tax=Pseudomonas sputi TaxID=2892325 RepID=UPI001F181B4C|nr:hypothetical protein [Pseudomonas sputi]
MKSVTTWMGVLAALSLSTAQAVNKEIRAVFQPDPSKPGNNMFINTTPNSGYCADYPGQCADNKMFSIRAPLIFQAVRSLSPGDGVSIRMPSHWRQVVVTNRNTQETAIVEVRMTGVGSEYHLNQSAASLVGVSDPVEAHSLLWGSGWMYAPTPCQYAGIGLAGSNTFRFFWKAPVEVACTKFAAYRIPSMAFSTLDFAYELRTPNPLTMSSGQYTGSMPYMLGSGGHIDFGALMRPLDSHLTLDLVLDVQHTLKVDLPPGGNKVALEPEGGWQRWIASGTRPARIYRDQVFNISASAAFKVMMQCDSFQPSGPDCRLNGQSNTAWVHTTLSLPGGITGPDGAPVKDVPLMNYAWVGPFRPGQYVDRKSGNLRFEMPREAMDYLFRPGINDTLKGNITVIWDSEA